MRNAEGTQKQNQSSSLLPAHIHQQLPALLLLQPAASYTVHKLSAQDVLSRANPVQLCACREVTRSSHTLSNRAGYQGHLPPAWHRMGAQHAPRVLMAWQGIAAHQTHTQCHGFGPFQPPISASINIPYI